MQARFHTETDTPVWKQEACELYCLSNTIKSVYMIIDMLSRSHIDCLLARGPKVAALPTGPGPYIANVSSQLQYLLSTSQ